MVSFGSVLKRARMIAGISQEELAEKLCISRTSISRMENDKLEPRISDVIRWGQATQATELIAAMLCGIDVATLLQNISMLIGGFITWI